MRGGTISATHNAIRVPYARYRYSETRLPTGVASVFEETCCHCTGTWWATYRYPPPSRDSRGIFPPRYRYRTGTRGGTPVPVCGHDFSRGWSPWGGSLYPVPAPVHHQVKTYRFRVGLRYRYRTGIRCRKEYTGRYLASIGNVRALI